MKKRFKRLGAMLLAGTMLLGATACGGGSNSSTTGNAAKSEDSASTTETGGTTSSGDIDTSEHVVITYMVTGDKPDGKSAERLDEMMEKLNAILTEKVNAELEIYYIGWTDYLSNYNLTLAQMDGSVDLVGTASDWLDAWPNAKNGAFLELSEDMLKTYAPKTWESVSQDHWDLCKYNGSIYLIPEDNYAQWTNHGFIYRLDWAKEAGLTDGVKSWEDLTTYFKYVKEAYDTNWMSTVGANINEVEKVAAEKSGVKYAVALSCCTAALHLCVKFAGEKLYGKPEIGHGAVEGKRVFCSDMTFDATLNPVVYEGGIPVFVDTEKDSWNMDPVALEKAFEMYPEVKLVVSAELYGFSGDIKKIKEICEKHGALLIEDAAEAMGATWDGKQCGSYGDYAAVSYNGNKIITGSSGGCLLTNDLEVANKARKWSTQAREAAAWYQHEEVGYNYRMSNVIAGIIRGQYNYLEEHIAQKKVVY